MKVLNRKFAVRWRVTTVQLLLSPPQSNILLFVPKGIQNFERYSKVDSFCPWALSCRSLNCLPDQSSSLIPRPFRIERKLDLTCLNTRINLQYKHHKRATQLIVTIPTDINACNNNIFSNNKREERITSCLWGWFLLIFFNFFFVFGFFGYFLCFCFSWVL